MKRPVLALLSAMTLSSAALATPEGYFVGGFGELNLTDGKKTVLPAMTLSRMVKV